MTDAFTITIFHNPNCGTSRNALAMIEAAGHTPTVIEYLKAGWTRTQLEDLFQRMGMTARQLLREKGTPATELGLFEPGATEGQILAAMVETPILVNRPIVITPKGVKLCRPSEVVLTLLDRPLDTFTKEDGEVVHGERGGS